MYLGFLGLRFCCGAQCLLKNGYSKWLCRIREWHTVSSVSSVTYSSQSHGAQFQWCVNVPCSHAALKGAQGRTHHAEVYIKRQNGVYTDMFCNGIRNHIVLWKKGKKGAHQIWINTISSVIWFYEDLHFKCLYQLTWILLIANLKQTPVNQMCKLYRTNDRWLKKMLWLNY